jgi:outer membrane protein TolC
MIRASNIRGAIWFIVLTGAAWPQAIQLPLSGRAVSQSGSVNSVQTPIPGVTSSVNTLNSSVQVQGPYSGSASDAKPFSGKLSFREAIERALEYNLGVSGLTEAIRQARGQSKIARGALLPNLNAALRETVQQTDLAALGLRINVPVPGFRFPTVVGPFNFFDLRATLTQTVADLTALNNYRSAGELIKANAAAMRDARDLVVLATGGVYLQAAAASARIHSAEAQRETSQALLKQTQDRRSVGLVAQIDVNRAQVELQTQEQRLTTLRNDLSKQKINLARIAGLPVTDAYELTDDVPYSPAPNLNVEQAIEQALSNRADLQSAAFQVRSAERSRAAARAERLPSLALTADYGAIGINPSQSHGTFSVTGALRIPIWAGGRTEGSIAQAEAALDQRRSEATDVRGRIVADVRNAFLDLQAAAQQIDLARNNQGVARETLELTRQRYEAGVTDSLEVIQARQAIASAELDYITAVFAHNLAKVSLARALGKAEASVGALLGLP